VQKLLGLSQEGKLPSDWVDDDVLDHCLWMVGEEGPCGEWNPGVGGPLLVKPVEQL
jgi:hypothetical protein